MEKTWEELYRVNEQSNRVVRNCLIVCLALTVVAIATGIIVFIEC